MPIKSKRQWKWMFREHPAMARRWARHTPGGYRRLPEKVKRAAFKSTVTTPQYGTLHVEKLDQITARQPSVRRRTSELLRRHHLNPATGFSEARVARAGQTDKSIILDEDDNVLDGRHRLVYAHRHGGVVRARVATPEQVAACRTEDDGDKSDVRMAFDPVAAVRLFDAGKTVHEICRLTGATWAAVRGALLAAGRAVKNPMRGASLAQHPDRQVSLRFPDRGSLRAFLDVWRRERRAELEFVVSSPKLRVVVKGARSLAAVRQSAEQLGAEVMADVSMASDDGRRWDKLVKVREVYSDLEGGKLVIADVHVDNQLVGSVGFSDQGDRRLYPELVYVKPEYRRQGVASAMYRKVQSMGYKIQAGAQTKEGKKFRAQFDGKVSPSRVVQALKEIGVMAAVVGGAVLFTVYGGRGLDAAARLVTKYGGRLVRWVGKSASMAHVPGGHAIHVRARYADDATAQRAKSYFEQLLRHRGTMEVGPGQGELQLHTTMPSVIPGVQRRGLHDHPSWIEFLRSKVEKTGGAVTKVVDSTVANSFAFASDIDAQPTRRDIARAVSEALGVTQASVNPVVRQTLLTITDKLMRDRRVELRGFGVFELQRRRARFHRDPNRGQAPIFAPDKVVIVFKPSSRLRQRLEAPASFAMSLASQLGGTFSFG